MGWFHRDKQHKNPTAVQAQLRDTQRHPFGALDGYVPLRNGEIALYRSIREAVPMVDAAILKLIRLAGGVHVKTLDQGAQAGLEHFIRTVNTGRGQRGLQSFLDGYLDAMLTCGRAVGEIVLSPDHRDVAALLCGDPASLEIKEGASPLEFALCLRKADGMVEPLPRQDLLLFTPFQPESGSPYGVSLLRSMPFLTGILLKIYQAMGLNWERMGNVRFAVVYKPGDSLDRAYAQERSQQIAKEWSAAMQAGKAGSVRDFVAVGDVDIKVIGADNQILDSEVPVRQILEQLVARTGVPPFLLGLTWSSTERMSTQQADMLTSELAALRRSLEPVVERICEWWLRLHGFDQWVEVVWEDISLQDLVEEARAALYRAQADQIRQNMAQS
ncbi:serine/threonine protein phosphatase [Pseudoflavonifractor phocaeensis]|uniref:serine/threonine protein phosphatase n=1 Tax=Pseudoflavonifractor phocaeensis TaxID=1870988 RepID=UPI00195D99BB|nr:serine/threonine protein phosphatase [Pseudoflavonifractor phocaeensis]MBM6870422.1 serine/threonine protein phosphatase [Pseudoflavonifractor phocaeensis]MBM6938704.1 serine/threonine protein phosphatase [Pseudoflavonifractor phocaeensis]